MKTLFFAGLLILFSSLRAQTLSRHTISSASGSNSQNGMLIRETVGQPYQTNTSQSSDVTLRPGFQQPVFYTEILSTNIDVKILPNPALNSFFIESSDTLLNATLTAIDAAGKMIYSKQIPVFTKIEVFCSEWANGIYFLKVEDEKNRFVSSKLIKHN